MINITSPGQKIQAKAEGYNAGFQAAADRFELWIFILLGLFLLKVVIKAPPVDKRLSGWKGYELVETLEFSADVLAFFIVVVMAWVASGRALFTIN